jgi:hypothetical protein
MRYIFIFYFLMIESFCIAQSDSLVNKYLGTQRDVWQTSNPILCEDKIIFFSSSFEILPFGKLYMHSVDTCGDNYRVTRITEIDSFGATWYGTMKAKKAKDGTILLCGNVYFDKDTTYPLILKLNQEGKLLFKSKKPILDYETELYPYDIAETPDGFIITGYYVITPDPPFLLAGAMGKFDKEGNLLWHDYYPGVFGHIPVSIETFDTTTNFRVYGVSAWTPSPTTNTYSWALFDKDGKRLRVQLPPKDNIDKGHQHIERVGKRIVMIGKWDVITQKNDGVVQILDDSLKLIKKYVFPSDTANGLEDYFPYQIIPTPDEGFIVTMINYGKGDKLVNETFKFDKNNNLVWKYKSKNATREIIVNEITNESIFIFSYIRFRDTLDNMKYALTKLNAYGKAASICETINANDAIMATSNYYQLSPNPSSDYFKIFTLSKNVEENVDIAIYNSLGSLITTQKNIQTPLSIATSNWQAGLYFIELIDQNTQKKQLMKLLKI